MGPGCHMDSYGALTARARHSMILSGAHCLCTNHAEAHEGSLHVQDMAAAVAYLASEDASYVTGETVVVAGGMHSRL